MKDIVIIYLALSYNVSWDPNLVHDYKMNGSRLCFWSIDNWIMVLLTVLQDGIMRDSMVQWKNLSKVFLDLRFFIKNLICNT